MAFNIDDYLATESVPYNQQQNQSQNLTTYEQQAFASQPQTSYDQYTGYPSAGVPETKYTPQSSQSDYSGFDYAGLMSVKSPAQRDIDSNGSQLADGGILSTLRNSLSDHLKKNGGEIFTNAMMGSAASVLKFLADRRAQRQATELIDKKYQNETNAKNTEIARASAMPTLTSVVKPTVTGRQLVGNQRQAGGLINAARQRSA